jgi:YHS domain-containing protein
MPGRIRGESSAWLANRILEGEDMEKVKDLVCGMTIDPQTAAATSEYKGKTYYFCAKGCKVAFDKNPEKYVPGEGTDK